MITVPSATGLARHADRDSRPTPNRRPNPDSRPSLASRPSRPSLANWLLVLALTACASGPDYLTNNSAGRPGLEELHRSLPDSSGVKLISESAAAALALKARLDEALGRPADAARRWLIAGRSPTQRPWALARLAGLLDLVPLTATTASTASTASTTSTAST